MSTQSVLEYASRKIGGVPRLPPVVGGSGRRYWTIAAALAGESVFAITVAGVVPQAGTQAGVVVFQAGQSAVNNFYQNRYVLNTDITPSNGLVSQFGKISNYVGASRTATLDKPWDFSAESIVSIIQPARIALEEDVTEDVAVTIPVEIDLQGHKITGKVDITAGNFCWIRGGSGFITNGIQKTDFGLLKVDSCAVSRRDATIYALLLTNGSDLGRCELKDCEFMGRVSGRRGYSGWFIQNCKNFGVPGTVYDVPYTLVESIAGVAITLTALDVGLDTAISGAIVYSENSITGAGAYLSILGSIRSTADAISTNDSSKKLSLFTGVAAGILTPTFTSGAIIISPGDVDANANAASTGILAVFSLLEVVNFTGTATVTLSTGGGVRISFPSMSNGSCIQISGTVTMSGAVTLAGTDTISILGQPGSSFLLVRIDVAITGSITLSGSGVVAVTGSSTAVLVIAASITAGTPTVTISKSLTVEYGNTMGRMFLFGAVTVSVGTYNISAGLSVQGYQFTQTIALLSSAVTGGTWNVSGSLIFASVIAGDNATNMADHQGSGGVLTVSGTISCAGFRSGMGGIALATGAGATVNVSSTDINLRDMTITSTIMARAVTATSTASLTGNVSFINCTFTTDFTLVVATAVGGVVTGPTLVVFDHTTFLGVLITESGSGTITWASATLTFRFCHLDLLFTIVGTRFSSVQAFKSTFNGNSGNNSISHSGSRPTVYRLWNCSFPAGIPNAAGTPEIIDEWVVRPASGALSAGNLLTINSSGQATAALAGSVVEGVALAAVAGVNNPAIMVRRGTMFVDSDATVAAGNSCVLDTATTPTNQIAGAAVVGQRTGRALEAAAATRAGEAYSVVNLM